MASKKEYNCVQCGVDLFRPKADHLKANERCPKCNKENRRKRLTEEQTGPKACTKCGETKPRTAEYFPLHNKKADGLDSWCRSCRNSYRKETRRGKYREMISDDQLKENLANFSGCEICGKETEDPVVDHCHKKSKYRGLLCNHCNRGLGHFLDDPEVMAAAIEYLKKHSS